MPSKTKKQKILAQTHRKFSFSLPATVAFSESQMPKSDHTGTQELDFIRRDLKKTIFLGIVAVCVELALFVQNFWK